MTRGTGASTARGAGVSPKAVRSQIDRILASSAFARSERMRRFLRFTVGEVLEGRAGQLKEYLVGVEVFDRKASYDSRVDPIVRVEARRLRSKLRTYYETEGRSDAVLIEYPTGSYVPQFRAREPHAIEAPRGTEAESCAEEKSIVVLPFTNLSADPENEYFSDGLTEELIHALTKIEGLRVVAWPTAFQLKDKPYDLRSIGEQLKVGAALGGSVRRSGDRLRVSAQLVLVSDGRYLWSETYERQMKDVFAIQDEIAQAIAGRLRIRLAAPRRREYDLVAYNLYLRGRFHWNKRSPDELKRSIQYYERAISVDPDFSLGYAGLADSYSLLAEYGLVDPAGIIPKARSAASKALELDPTLAEAYTSLGLITSVYDWDWRQGEEHYKRAIALNPGYATAHHWYSIDFLASLGRLEEAWAELQTALQLDPLSAIINEGEGYLQMLSRRYDDAIAAFEKLLELDPHFYKAYTALGRVYSLKGCYEDAIAMLEKGREMAAGNVPSILGALGQTYALSGKEQEARRLLETLSDLTERGYVSSTCFALIHAGLGENARALEWLELACDRHELSIATIYIHPAYDTLRSEPRFKALLQRIGFEQ